jgi:hypothetical protein
MTWPAVFEPVPQESGCVRNGSDSAVETRDSRRSVFLQQGEFNEHFRNFLAFSPLILLNFLIFRLSDPQRFGTGLALSAICHSGPRPGTTQPVGSNVTDPRRNSAGPKIGRELRLRG